VEALRRAVPDITLTSDVIVGFPGETEEDFNKTLEVLKRVEFDSVYSFVYSEREGTRAKDFDSKVPDEIKSRRITELLDIQAEISLKRNMRHKTRVERVLVDCPTKNGKDGVFDGRTLSGKLVHFPGNDSMIGQYVNVKIERAGAFDLFGVIAD
jgi:tRNA-2-methylthio-N6-dimethylallyladenosine synthase